MAIADLSELIQNTELVEDDNGIMYKTRVQVREIDPAQPCQLFHALNATNLPVWGQSHPVIPGIKVRSRIPRPFLNSKTETQVELVYRSPDLQQLDPNDRPIVKFRGFTREVKTNFYADHQRLIEVRYTPGGAGGHATRPAKSQISSITAYKAFGVLEFELVRNSDPSWMLKYYNKLNRTPWRGYGQYCWFCSEIGIERQKGRSGYKVNAVFILDEETHIKTAFYRLHDGSIPEDIPRNFSPYETTVDFGFANVAPAMPADFNLLGLPSGF